MSLGKMLGGTTCLNAMLYAKGSPSVFNAWASLENSGWDYESVLPYFKKFKKMLNLLRIKTVDITMQQAQSKCQLVQ